jgi:hypothetical protein
MLDLEARAKALCSGPAGCGFLLTIEESALPPEVAARPEICIEAAAIAQHEIGPFMPDHGWTVATVLAEGPRLLGFARSLLSVPEAGWLFAPLDRSAQLWISEDGAPPDPAKLLTPSAPPTNWERYAQKPANNPRGSILIAFVTSTPVGEGSSVLAGAANGAGDWDFEPPVQQYRLRVAATARVFEVDGPDAWHRLCAGYPATGEDGRIVPDWSAVARDWDAVHLTLGGQLSAEQVRVESPAGWSELWGWDNEQTLWLRWCFTAVERLPVLEELPRSTAGLSWPRWIWQLEHERIRQGLVPGAAVLTARIEDSRPWWRFWRR